MRLLAVLLISICFMTVSRADQIVQEVSLGDEFGFGLTLGTVQEFPLEQFNQLDGTRRLNFVQFNVDAYMLGRGQSNNSGTPTQVSLRYLAFYYTGGVFENQFGMSDVMEDAKILNDGPPEDFFLIFSSSEQTILDKPDELSPWVGSGEVLLASFYGLLTAEDPPDSVGIEEAFAIVNLTVIYDFTNTVLLGDVNLDGVVDLLDVTPFVDLLMNANFQLEADINQDGTVDLLDVQPFVDLLTN